jgi:hypothetical protein
MEIVSREASILQVRRSTDLLTKLTIRNFKRLEEAEIELGHPVLFVGPNNSGKTSALQALSLWEIGVKRWSEKRGTRKPPGKRPGAAINRRDLIAIPVPEANLLWRNLHVREVTRSGSKAVTTTNAALMSSWKESQLTGLGVAVWNSITPMMSPCSAGLFESERGIPLKGWRSRRKQLGYKSPSCLQCLVCRRTKPASSVGQ